MRTNLIYSNQSFHPGYGAGCGDTELYEYECPCGKGTIREEHDNIPGFREHDVFMCCDECKRKYKFDTTTGVRNWELVEINDKI